MDTWLRALRFLTDVIDIGQVGLTEIHGLSSVLVMLVVRTVRWSEPLALLLFLVW